MKIGILGKGTVGTAVYNGLADLGHHMSFHDPGFPGSSINDVLVTELVFVCVPTDSTATGDCDTSIVESVCAELSARNYTGLVCIKSTVIPGTTDLLIQKYQNISICFVPEFLRAKTAYADFILRHEVLVIGAYEQKHFDLVKESHGSYPQSVVCIDPKAAEMSKYFHNVHNAMEITFANVIYSICANMNIDYQQVYEAISKRSNISPSYLKAGDQWGSFGGHCLPKDTLALANLQHKLGLDHSLITAILSDNEKFKK